MGSRRDSRHRVCSPMKLCARKRFSQEFGNVSQTSHAQIEFLKIGETESHDQFQHSEWIEQIAREKGNQWGASA